MTKGIWAGLVAIAFVAGSLMTGTMASAEKGGVGDNLIVDAINALTQIIADKDVSTDVTVEAPNVEVNVPPADVQVIGVEGPPGPAGQGCSISDTIVTCGDTSSDVQGPQGIPGLPGAEGQMGPPGESFTQVIRDNSSGDFIRKEISSDRDYIMHVCVTTTDPGTQVTLMEIFSNPPTYDVELIETGFDQLHGKCITVGGIADENLLVRVSSGGFAELVITVHTTSAATASITDF